MRRRDFLTGTTLVGLTAALDRSALAEAATAAAPSVSSIALEDFFREARFDQLALSPDGRRLACLVAQGKHMNLATIDLADNKVTALTKMSESDVQEFHWISNERLIFRLRDELPDPNYGTQGTGLWAINWDGTDGRELVPPNNLKDSSSVNQGHGDKGMVFVDREYVFVEAAEGSDDIIVASNEISTWSVDLFRMNSHNGRKTLLTPDRPAHVDRWILDRQQQPRIAKTFDPETAMEAVYHRSAASEPWRRVAEWPALENDGFEPITFDYDGSLLVSARGQQDKAALYRYDLAAGKLGEKIVGHKDYDLGYGNGNFLARSAASALIFDAERKKLAGVRIDAAKPHFVWFDDRLAKLHATLEASLPGRIVLMKPTSDGQKVLVTAYSDRDPGTWYLFEPAKGSLRELVSRRPWIKPEQMASRKPLRYAARDGLSIPAYLTLPPGIEAKRLPAVMLPHGGPFVRGEFWRWDPWAQFLASRGYAVLQPDYRGSLGYGFAHHRAGWKQQGKAMQFDVADGARWLIEQGIADPKRIAILGHSAGGYATMMGLVLEPELYRCGANSAGPTDLIQEERYRTGGHYVPGAFDYFHEKAVGTVAKDRALLEENSPARHGDRIKVPVLMAYGNDDPTVPRFHADAMASALKSAGVKYDLVVYPGQGHWWDEETTTDYFRRVEKFLADNMA